MLVNKKETISSVLGSSGARGYAHIGVIEALLEYSYEIKSIFGSSMGALIGAFAYEMIELGRIITKEHLKESV